MQSLVDRARAAGEINGLLPGGYGHGAIFVGSAEALNERTLRRLGISSLLTLLTPAELREVGVPSCVRRQKVIEIEDEEHELISEHFEGAYEFIQAASQAGNVLIHCRHGISRSGAVAIAYLMRRLGWSASRAYSYAKECRPVICPNLSFCQQIRAYQHSIVLSNDWEVAHGQLLYEDKAVEEASTMDSELLEQAPCRGPA
jgi:predicted protein tyrosine phosphatase